MYKVSANTNLTIRSVQEEPIQDYIAILDQYGMPYILSEHHLYSGEITRQQGWIIHLSAIISQLPVLLCTIIPVLKDMNMPFKIPKNKETAKAILDGQHGYVKLGKVVSIYPSSDEDALNLVKSLLPLTERFRGPRILTDLYLGANIYTRYGAYEAVVLISESGRTDNFMTDIHGNLIKDIYSIPYIPPINVPYPFRDIAPTLIPQTQTLIKGQYKPIQLLKADARGDVFKALYLRKFFFGSWCVIKRGNRFMASDDQGRDISDRLLWQQKAHNDLYGTIAVPKIYEFCEVEGDSYLVMEYIKGTSLDERIVDLFKGQTWQQLQPAEKLQILNYTEQVLDIIQRMHEQGYVHRDINTMNFIINKRQQLVLIDLELVYSLASSTPLPPFRLGTDGFMSPEQRMVMTPTIAQDIYAVGATLLILFTGLVPNKFEVEHVDTLKKQLAFFIPYKPLTDIIASCFHHDPTNRPDLETINNVIHQFRDLQIADEPQTVSDLTVINPSTLESMIESAIQALSSPLMLDSDKLWFSNRLQDDTLAYYQMQDRSVYGGVHAGVAGVLYLLARARIAGFSVNSCSNAYMHGLNFLRKEYIPNASKIPTGLYAGTAGIALALAEGLESGLIANVGEVKRDIQACLQNQAIDGIGIARGTAGQGIALLRCADLLDGSFVTARLQQLVTGLVTSQQKDGSWLIMADDQKTLLKLTGFGHGVSGITCFLLQYCARFKDSAALETAARALKWLTRKAGQQKGLYTWSLHDRTRQTDIGMNNGNAGIALAFIKAYALFGDTGYRKIAEGALKGYPFCITSRDLTMTNGLAGIGESYLEAFNIFQTPEWMDRANWIAQLFLHHFRQSPDNSCYWQIDPYSLPTADLMAGNGGAIHFLTRYLCKGKMTHPLLPV